MVESTEDLTDQLTAYVRASTKDRAFIAQCADRAVELVSSRVGEQQVPTSVLSAAHLEVGANLYQRRASAIGTTNYSDPETFGNPMRPALDPMTPAWPMLRPYLGPGLA